MIISVMYKFCVFENLPALFSLNISLPLLLRNIKLIIHCYDFFFLKEMVLNLLDQARPLAPEISYLTIIDQVRYNERN